MTQPVNATWSAKQGKFRKPSAIVANFPKKETEGVYKYRLKHRGQITTNSTASVSRAHSVRISLSIHRSIFNVLVKNKPTTVPMDYSILLKTGSLGDAIQELLLAYYTIPNALSRTNCQMASKREHSKTDVAILPAQDLAGFQGYSYDINFSQKYWTLTCYLF